MRKKQTSLTYKTLKQREIFQVIKKSFCGEKTPVRLLYKDVYGTETSPLDEFSYIGICLWEGLNIIGSHYLKNFSQVKMPLDLFEEVRYIVSCLCETLNIIGSHYMKKIPKYKNGL